MSTGHGPPTRAEGARKLPHLALVGLLLMVMMLTASPRRAFTADRSGGVTIVGDGIVASDPVAYRTAFAREEIEVTSLSAAPGRRLRSGWQCRSRTGYPTGFHRLRPSSDRSITCAREGLEALSELSRLGRLGDTVLIALGIGDALSDPMPSISPRLSDARRIVGSRHMVLVAPAALRTTMARSARKLTMAMKAWCSKDRNCEIIRWDLHPVARRSASYRPDGILLTETANQARSRFLARSLRGSGHTSTTLGSLPDPSTSTSSVPAPTSTTSSTIPADAPLSSTVLVSDDGELGVSGDGVGAFRIVCPYSHSSSDDPIVKPGQPGKAHLHAFFANREVDAFTTQERLLTGTSTCPGGSANRSGYWVPAMLGPAGEVTPTELVAYYKSGYGGVAPADVRPIPEGLRIVAGEPSRTEPDDRPSWMRHTFWSCVRLPDGAFTSNTAEMQACPAGWNVVMSVQFPQCWDGRRLDSSDHIGHMAYPDNGCPLTHPVPIPAITLNIYWFVGSSTSGWRLSSDMYDGPAGRSAHADWWNGWDPVVVSLWMRHCVNAGLDCGASNLGDGRRLR